MRIDVISIFPEMIEQFAFELLVLVGTEAIECSMSAHAYLLVAHNIMDGSRLSEDL